MFTAFSGHPASVHGGVHGPTVLAAALSLSLTGALMVLFKVSHPPAGATTLIVSLGIIALPRDLLVIEAAVIPLTLQAFVLNRLAGMPYPLWQQHPST
jgi:CBS domain-containing membrane protein